MVLARFNWSKWDRRLTDAETLTIFKDYAGRDVNGRFCKSGDPREMCVVAPVKYSREQLSQGLVTILGTAIGSYRRV